MADAISSTYRKLSTKQRYIINSILVVAFLAIGEAMISGGVISRYHVRRRLCVRNLYHAHELCHGCRRP